MSSGQETQASDPTTFHRHVRLGDPDRAQIIAEIRCERPPAVGPDRLNNVAQPTIVDGHRFPSRKEARRYGELKLGERAGTIAYLQLQVTFPLIVNDVPIFPQGYRSDFVYLELQQDQWKSWKLVVEDAKGVVTDTYAIKEKLILAIYGIQIRRT